MQKTDAAIRIRKILEDFRIVRSCDHEPEVEARYECLESFKFHMCRKCWESESCHKTGKDSIQIVRQKQLGVIMAKCLACGEGMESCGCAG